VVHRPAVYIFRNSREFFWLLQHTEWLLPPTPKQQILWLLFWFWSYYVIGWMVSDSLELLQSLICQEPLTTIPEDSNPNEHQLENLISHTDPLKCMKISSLEDSLVWSVTCALRVYLLPVEVVTLCLQCALQSPSGWVRGI